MIDISGWGLYPKIKANKNNPLTIEELKLAIKSGKLIARGNGRSYGDSAISQTNTIDMKGFNRFLDFNKESGLLIVQAGILLSEVINIFLPRGWFPFVTPGTKYVTIGGMVAADVHGKNHHKNGSFINHVEWIEILNEEGEIIRCSKKSNSKLFNMTFGGMGLTGIIINVAFFLKPVETSWIKQKTFIANNIEKAIKIFEEALDSTYSVAWIDCQAKGKNLGRSLVMLGEHAEIKDLKNIPKKLPLFTKTKKKISIPFYFPQFILNKFSVKIFNDFYYFIGASNTDKKLVDWDTFFYPLDKISNWNKIYGKRGFAQFQCVIPLKNGNIGIKELLEAISNSQSISFLSVLKRFGSQTSSFSFPMEGYSIAMDFPINKRNLDLMQTLDKIVIKYGGRFYLAKDSRLKREIFLESDKRIKYFQSFRNDKLVKAFESSQSERLTL